MPTDAERWFDQEIEQANPFPQLRQGDIGFWMGTSLISRGIANRVGRRGHVMKLSHVFMYDKRGYIAEATMPRGGRASLRKYLTAKGQLWMVRIPEIPPDVNAAMASRMVEIGSRPYDKKMILFHYIDWWFETLSWNDRKGRGFRPLAKLIKDDDKSNVCSEALERVFHEFTGYKFQEYDPGDARPYDVWDWCFAPDNGKQKGRMVMQQALGRMIQPQRWGR